MAEGRTRLEVEPREEVGTPAARRLRANGHVPGVLYGQGHKARSFSIGDRDLRRALTGEHGLHAILDVVFAGQRTPHHAVVKDFQLDPTRARVLHVDLVEVRLDQPIQSQVVVELEGEPEGVVQGGVLSQVTREVTVEALPMEIPDRISLDVSGVAIGDSLRVGDLRVPEGVRLLDDEETVLITVTPPTRVELPEEMVTEEEAEAAAPEAPEEQRPEAATEAPAEPEADAAGEQQTVEG